MFEGWVADLLASYLGHFVNIKREQLRISLWQAWSTGVVLEDLEVIPEAFDHLELPYQIVKGSVGRLEAQFPWSSIRNRTLVIKLHNVALHVAPRDLPDWEAASATRRAHASKQAQLAAWELHNLPGKLAGGKPGRLQDSKRQSQSLTSHLASMLLDRLQLSVNGVLVCFEGLHPDAKTSRAGLQLGKLTIASDSSTAAQEVLRKSAEVEDFAVFWQPGAADDQDLSSSTSQGWMMIQSSHTAARAIAPEDYLIRPCTAAMQLVINRASPVVAKPDQAALSLQLHISVSQVQMQASSKQVQDIQTASCLASFWTVRGKHAALCPDGWRTRTGPFKAWIRRAWQFAISCVLQDLRSSLFQAQQPLRRWQHVRRRYILLHQQRLALLEPLDKVPQLLEQLHDLEKTLNVSDIILFRKLAESALEANRHGEEPSSTSQKRGWIAWGLSGMASFAGISPSQAIHQDLMQAPAEPDIDALYDALRFGGSDDANSATAVTRLQSSSVTLQVKQSRLDLIGPESLHGCGSGFAVKVEYNQAGCCQASATLQRVSIRSKDPEVGEDVLQVNLQQDGQQLSLPRSSSWSSDFADTAEHRPFMVLTFKTSLAKQREHHLDIELQPLRLNPTQMDLAVLLGYLTPNTPLSLASMSASAADALPHPRGRLLAKACRLTPGRPWHVGLKMASVSIHLGSTASRNHALRIDNIWMDHHTTLSKERLAGFMADIANAASADLLSASEQAAASLRCFNSRLKLEGVQICSSSLDNLPGQGDVQFIIAPLCISAAISSHALAQEVSLPALDIDMDLSPVTARLTDELLSFLQPGSSQAASSASAGLFKDQPQLWPGTCLRMKLAELAVELNGLMGHDADAASISLSSRAEKLQLEFHAGQEGMSATVSMCALRCEDASLYTTSRPRVHGTFPRLARHIQVQELAACARILPKEWRLAVTLHDITSNGFSDEPANFIARESNTVPAKAHVAVSKSADRQHIAITLQDGSVGATVFMRIAALLQNPHDQHAAPAAVTAADEGSAADCPRPEEAPSATQADDIEDAKAGNLKQFSLHIVRCNCILKPAAARRGTRSGRGIPGPALLLNIPDFSLQLPPMCPASLLMPLPCNPQQLAQAAEMHFASDQANQVLHCSSVSLSITPSEGSSTEPLLSLPSAYAALGSKQDLETAESDVAIAAHVPIVSSHLSLKDARALAVVLPNGLHDWSCLSSHESPAATGKPAQTISVTRSVAVKVDCVKLRILLRAEQHALDLICNSLALDHTIGPNRLQQGSIGFSQVRLEYGLAALEADQDEDEPIRSASPQDEFVQPLGPQLSRTLSAPLGMETEVDPYRRFRRVSRRHSRDSHASLTPRARSGLLDSTTLGGLAASSSHSGSFSNIPGIRPSKDSQLMDSHWPVAGHVSRRLAHPGMVRAPSRLNRWLQQLPASQEEAGHGLTAAFYGAGSSSGSVGDMTEILDPADFEDASAMSLEDNEEAAASEEGPAFDHALLFCIRGIHQQPVSITLASRQLGAEQRLQLEASVHLAVFAQGAPEAAQDIAEWSTALSASWRHADQHRGLKAAAPLTLRSTSETLLTIVARDCCLELVDNMPAGMGSALSFHLNATALVVLEATATVLRSLDLNQLTCSVSAVDIDNHSKDTQDQLDHGLLAAVSGLKLSISQERSVHKITAKLADISVWASFHRICPVVATGVTACRLQSRLSRMAIKLGWLSEYPAQEDALLTRIGSSFEFDGAIHQMAVLIATSESADHAPAFEIALQQLTLQGSYHAEDRHAHAQLCTGLLGNVYNISQMGWQPVVEPLNLRLTSDHGLPQATEQPKSEAPSSPKHSVSICLVQPLELVASLALADCAALVLSNLRRLQRLASHPSHCSLLMLPPIQSTASAGSAFMLSNQTGLKVTAWLTQTSKAGVAPQNAGIQIHHGQSVALPVITTAATAWHGMFVRKQTAEGRLSSQKQQVSNHNLQRNRLSFLHIQLEGQQGSCGPLLLETLVTTRFEAALMDASSGRARSVQMVLQTSARRGGGCNILLHSGLQIKNASTLMMSIGTAERNGDHTTQAIQAGLAMWLPLAYMPSTDVRLLPTEHEGPVLGWSREVPFSAAASNMDKPEVLLCPQASNPAVGLSFCTGIQRLPAPEGASLVIGAPLVVQNALPMPVQVLLRPDGYRNAGPTRLAIYPRRQVALYHLKLDDVDSMMVQPSGFQWCSSIKLPFAAASEGDPCPESTSADVTEAVEGGRAVPIQITRQQDAITGAYTLMISCALWVYNCTGLPVALQQLQQPDNAEAENSYQARHIVEDDVPKRWVAPYEGTAEDPIQTQSSSGSVSDSQPSSRPSYAGLGKLLGSSASTSQADFRLRAGSKARSSPLSQGMAEGMESVPSYATPTRWPSMQGGPFFHKRHVQLQVRTSQRQAPIGRTYWSSGVQLDAVGAAAVVLVPCPSAAYGQMGPPSDGAYIMSVSAKQVVGGNGALAVQLMPRYMLQNMLDMPIQYKQQGTAFEHELGTGKSRAIYWSDAAKPLLLCMRVQEAGWLWSGGVSLEGPGDQFVKIRHRDRQYTKLLRVDVSVTAEGVLLAALSHEAEGFAPYRLDNCTGETLHVSQEDCADQHDILRPYSSLPYAWDEPASRHRLVVSLPGNRKLGAFSLDEVGLQKLVQLPANQRSADPDQKLQVLVRADGPTLVLLVSALQVHWPSQAPSASGLTAADDPEWLPWSGALVAASPDATPPATPQGMNLEVLIDIPSVGISAAFPTHEVLYARVTGVLIRAVASNVKATLEMCIKSLQVDNPLQAASYPVLCTAPAAFSSFSAMTEVLKAASSAAAPSALCMRAASWLRRPGGVLCIERFQVLISPLTVEAEQRHLMDVAAFFRACLVPFRKDKSASDRPPDDEPNLGILSSSKEMSPARQVKIYLEWLYISRVCMTISFLPAARHQPAQGRLDRILALAGELEGGRLRLAAFELQHPLLGITALKQRTYAHYLRTALPEFIKLMGSSNFLGDPMRLVHHLGFGLYSFLMQPAAGFVSSREQGLSAIGHGLEEGIKSLVSNVIIAFTNATAKATSQGRRSLAFLGLEQEARSTVALSPQLQWHGGLQLALHSADPGLLNALLAGLMGILSEPIRGFDEAGLVGLGKGLMLGISGSITRPLLSGLEMSGNIARSIRDAVMEDSAPSQRLRPPRFVTHMTPLAPYNWHEALGRCLAADVARGQFSRERFLACFQLAGLLDFIVLTHVRLLRILSSGLQAPPFLLGTTALNDILLLQRSSSQPLEVKLLILQQYAPCPSLLSSLQDASAVHSRPVTAGIASQTLIFQDASDAAGFSVITQATMQIQQRPMPLLGESRLGFAGVQALK